MLTGPSIIDEPDTWTVEALQQRDLTPEDNAMLGAFFALRMLTAERWLDEASARLEANPRDVFAHGCVCGMLDELERLSACRAYLHSKRN